MSVTEYHKENNGPEKATETPHPKKKLARFIYASINWLGINWIVNSGLSLWITFNTLPTDTAQAGMGGLKKVFRPISIIADKIKGLFNKSELASLSEEAKEFKIGESARSTAEVFCMFIAGSLVLPFMKGLENRKEGIIDKIDDLIHPSHKSEKPDPQEKLTWPTLLKARVLGMIGILAVNHGMQSYNTYNISKPETKWNKNPKSQWLNSDVMETRFGSWLFGKCNESFRKKIIWVFSGFSRQGVGVEKIQPDMQKRAFEHAPEELKAIVSELGDLNTRVYKNPELDKVGFTKRRQLLKAMREEIAPEQKRLLQKIADNPEFKPVVERAIFAEQTRLFSKEVSLTLIITGMMYVLAKGNFISTCLQKCGLKKKPAEPVVAAAPETHSHDHANAAPATEDVPQKSWANREQNQPRSPVAAPSGSFQEAVLQESAEPSVSI